MAIRGTTAFCSGGLGSLVANADLKQARLLRRIDEWVYEQGMADLVGPATEPVPTVLTEVPTELDLRGFSAVIWATGYRPAYGWLDPRALGPPRPGRSRWRRREPARPLPAGSAVPATAAFEPNRGIGHRRRRTLPAPRRLPGGHGTSRTPDIPLNPASAGANERTSGPQHDVLDRQGAPAASSSPARSAPIESTSAFLVANTRSCRVLDIGATPSIACVSIAPSSSMASSAWPIRSRAITQRDNVCHCCDQSPGAVPDPDHVCQTRAPGLELASGDE